MAWSRSQAVLSSRQRHSGQRRTRSSGDARSVGGTGVISITISALLCAAGALPNTLGFVIVSHGFSPQQHLAPRVGRSALQAERAATFGMGCFWAPAEKMLKTSGVVSTVAGYTGKPDASSPPSYDNVCFSRDWVEAVRVTYDDEAVTYRELLDAFFEAQEPKLGSRQYASIIFPADEDQAEVAKAWLSEAKEQRRVREKDNFPAAATTIEAGTKFYKAEGYHQEYWQKWRGRFAVGAALLAVATGALDRVIPDPVLADQVETFANGAFVVGGLAALAERVLDAEVVEI